LSDVVTRWGSVTVSLDLQCFQHGSDAESIGIVVSRAKGWLPAVQLEGFGARGTG
jgi:hypothetical protein